MTNPRLNNDSTSFEPLDVSTQDFAPANWNLLFSTLHATHPESDWPQAESWFEY